VYDRTQGSSAVFFLLVGITLISLFPFDKFLFFLNPCCPLFFLKNNFKKKGDKKTVLELGCQNWPF